MPACWLDAFQIVAEFRTRHCELQQSAEHGATKQSMTALRFMEIASPPNTQVIPLGFAMTKQQFEMRPAGFDINQLKLAIFNTVIK